jgi:ACT domain-containing protein
MSQKSRDTKKQLLLRNLASMPIVEVACKRTGVSRATYYRWRTEDEDFREDSDKALFDAIELMSDLAESQLLNNVKGGNMTAIIFWLKSHREAYHTASTAIRI